MILDYSVLDHGYVRLIDKWGSDERIIEAARMSTGKGFLGWGPTFECNACKIKIEDVGNPAGKMCPSCDDGKIEAKPGDEKLLRYLWEMKHATPFEMAGMTIEVQAPIFVFREWHRHRTQSYSELSARYTPLPDVNYVPTVERLMINAGTSNRQAGTVADSETLTTELAEVYRGNLQFEYANQESLYQAALKLGVPKELARIHLPVGRYSRMRASANLRNWLGFLKLRMAPNAQYEIRMFANAVGEIVKALHPRTWELFSSTR